jgi:hypothetical protein
LCRWFTGPEEPDNPAVPAGSGVTDITNTSEFLGKAVSQSQAVQRVEDRYAATT